jgi:hypothetical protein
MVNYTHRALKDGEVYFFFNESHQTISSTATLAGTGTVQIWDAADGTIHPLTGVAAANGSVDVPITLGPQGAMFLVIGPMPAGVGQPLPTFTLSQALASLDGDWTVTLGGAPTTTPLKSWQDLGAATFNGIAQYTKSFTLASLPQGQRVYLDLGNVSELAHVKLNGTDFDTRGWSPFLWDVTSAVKSGDNTLEVQVQLPPAGGRGFGGGGAGGRAGRGAGGGGAGGGAAGGAGRGAAGEDAAGVQRRRPCRMVCSGRCA